MFTINGIEWLIKFVNPFDKALYRDDGSLTIGMCDNRTQIIYINGTLQGSLLKKVICHEIVHAAMFSYDVQLDLQQEELVADLIATYGNEIIHIADSLFLALGNI